MTGGVKKRINTRARDPATGIFCSAPKPESTSEPKAQPKNQPADPATAANSVSEEQYNTLLDTIVKEHNREIARLTESSRDVDRQMQELEDKLELFKKTEQQKQEAEEVIKQEEERRGTYLQKMVREHGLEENCGIIWDGNFKEKLKKAFPDRRSNRYTSVKVLIVQCSSDDLGVSEEVDNLTNVFRHSYSFNVAKFSIPDLEPANALSSRVREFIGDVSPDTLLIFA
ncbi:hypothetical protein BOTCAL_0227g00090 [Botryotinia calthae]|uniref:Uncharacterized protein n=1 Tax=Botryotinia calthae TaxID=38488 RepID=A0A4Y8CYG1_9HELO|nr:hypothetical protein BOTCAL_0227g00090 [Botryotinia calthae]